MSLKQASRFIVIVAMVASLALLITANAVFPLFSMDSPKAEFSSWSNCKTSGGKYACYTKFSSPAAAAECSEMDDRTTTVAVFSIIIILASLQVVAVMVWEICGGTSPMANLHVMLYCWSGGIGLALAVLLTQTLIASLCNSPLTFRDDTGNMELGGILVCASAGASNIAYLLYAVAPAE
ncbi:membrane-associated protein, putative, partial [Bodo saltans]